MINQRPGLGPEILGSGAGSLVSYVAESFQSPPLEITVVQPELELIPARVGHFPLLLASFWLIESVVGSQTTPPTSFAGSNAARTNFFLAGLNTTPTNANVNGASPPSFTAGPNGQTFALTTRQIPNAAIYFGTSAPASGTGGYRCTARLLVRIVWIPVTT